MLEVWGLALVFCVTESALGLQHPSELRGNRGQGPKPELSDNHWLPPLGSSHSLWMWRGLPHLLAILGCNSSSEPKDSKCQGQTTRKLPWHLTKWFYVPGHLSALQVGLSNPLKISQSPPLNIVVNSIVLSILTGHQMQIGLDPTLKAEGDFGSCTDCSLLTAPRHPPIHPPTFWVQDPGGTSFSWHRQKSFGRFPFVAWQRLQPVCSPRVWLDSAVCCGFAVCLHSLSPCVGSSPWKQGRLGMPDCSGIFRCGSEASPSSTGREARLSEEACNLPAIFKHTSVWVLFSNSQV